MKLTKIKVFLAFVWVGIAQQNMMAQCPFTIPSQSFCVGSAVVFEGVGFGNEQWWNFNKEDSIQKDTAKRVTYKFNTPGIKTITYKVNLAGNICTFSQNIEIYAPPVVKLTLLDKDTQCFRNNVFRLLDSSYSKSGSGLHGFTQLETINNFDKVIPGTIRNLSFRAKNGPSDSIYYFVEDDNGCSADFKFNSKSVVRKYYSVSPLNISKNTYCDSAKVLLKVFKKDIQNFKSLSWNSGNGSVKNNLDSSVVFDYVLSSNEWTKKITPALFTADPNGCLDTFKFASIELFNTKIDIIASANSVCYSNADVLFSAKPSPISAQKILWNFGDPNSGPNNFNNRSLTPSHRFTNLGAFKVKLNLDLGFCGLKEYYDTIEVVGTNSSIEKTNKRIAQAQSFNPDPNKPLTVNFSNFTTFYHNDNTPENDDSTILIVGKRRHVFNAAGNSINPKNYVESVNRGNSNVNRFWDFDDKYALPCTTDSKNNVNKFCNCNITKDSLPTHQFPAWNKILIDYFSNTPMQLGNFNLNTQTLSNQFVYASDTFQIADDSLLIVPNNSTAIGQSNSGIYKNLKGKKYLAVNGLKGKSEYSFDHPASVQIPSGVSIQKGKVGVSGTTLLAGPATISVNHGDKLILDDNTDTVTFDLKLFVKRDTFPISFLPYFKNFYGVKKISTFKKTFSGTKNIDYVINPNVYFDLYYANHCKSSTVALKHTDVNKNCTVVNTKIIANEPLKAKGKNRGIIVSGQICDIDLNVNQGITFDLSYLQPGNSFTDIQINFDSACGKNKFTPLADLISTASGLPMSLSWSNYQQGGMLPNKFYNSYNTGNYCTTDGNITVGVIVGSGDDGTGKPTHRDTQWYHHILKKPMLDARFQMLNYKKLSNANKICRKDSIYIGKDSNNKMPVSEISEATYKIETANAGASASNHYSVTVKEKYLRNVYLPNRSKSKLYNILVLQRSIEKPFLNKLGWQDGKEKLLKSDTIVTAEISSWDTIADFNSAMSILAPRLLANSVDPFSITPKAFYKMIWNGKGTIGNFASGARGFIDTAGIGNLIQVKFEQKQKVILDPHDTAFFPSTKFKTFGNAYLFEPEFAGYYVASLTLKSVNGQCESFNAQNFIVGFHIDLKYKDSIIEVSKGNNTTVQLDMYYFHNDPLNFGVLDLNDYWRDGTRQLQAATGIKNREGVVKWDWNRADDDPSDTTTIFGGAPYGGKVIGPKNGYIVLGGAAGLYYKDTGSYNWCLTTKDSTGCRDTVCRQIQVYSITPSAQQLNVVAVDNEFAPTVAIQYNEELLLPQLLANHVATQLKPEQIDDYVSHLEIHWRDGAISHAYRNDKNEPGLSGEYRHKYYVPGNYEIVLYSETKSGKLDSFKFIQKVPGLTTKLTIADSINQKITLCENKSIAYKKEFNQASAAAKWHIDYGDKKNEIVDFANRNTNQNKTYTTSGKYIPRINMVDTVRFNSSLLLWCSVTYPNSRSGADNPEVKVINCNNINSKNAILTNWKVFPNPGSTELNITNVEKLKLLRVIDNIGRLVMEVDLTAQNTGRITVSELKSGLYMLQLIDQENKEYSTTWMKQ